MFSAVFPSFLNLIIFSIYYYFGIDESFIFKIRIFSAYYFLSFHSFWSLFSFSINLSILFPFSKNCFLSSSLSLFIHIGACLSLFILHPFLLSLHSLVQCLNIPSLQFLSIHNTIMFSFLHLFIVITLLPLHHHGLSLITYSFKTIFQFLAHLHKSFFLTSLV